MHPRVFDLEIDEWNESECARHGVDADTELFEVLDEKPVFLPNKGRHRAPMVMIGPTSSGRLLTVPLVPTDRDGVWRPATAWPSSQSERSRYEKAKSR